MKLAASASTQSRHVNTDLSRPSVGCWCIRDGAVIQRAMRHTSPETKRRYQLSMVEQVREAMEKANQRVYGDQGTIQ